MFIFNSVRKHKFFLSFIFKINFFIALLFHVNFSYGAIVAGTNFEPYVYPGDSIPWDFSSIQQVGVSGNVFSTNAKYSGDGNLYRSKKLDYVYCVTNNPSILNPDYLEIDDPMLVIQYAGAMTPMTSFLEYKISGLKVGSNFTITVQYYVLNEKLTSGTPLSFKLAIDPNSYGAATYAEESQNTVPQKKQTIKLSGKVETRDMTLSFLFPYHGAEKGYAIGITEILVDGTIDPIISSSQGIEACKGEQILLNLDKEYNAQDYQWEVKHKGGTWQSLSNKKTALYEIPSTANGDVVETFRCKVDGVVSNELEVTGITCCEVNGVAASRKTLLWETFGRFSGKHTYIDKDGNETTTPATWPPYRANLSYTIPQNEFDDGSGKACTVCYENNPNTANCWINDGFYAIVCPMKKGAYYVDLQGNQLATHMNGVSSDHTSLITGETNGGALFINVDYYFSGVVFEAEFENICSGKQVFYETWVANLSNQLSDPIVSLKFFDENDNEIEAINDFVVTANAGWLSLKGNFFLQGSSVHNVKMQLLSSCGNRCNDYGYWDKGNDLIIDDIKFMVCSPPSLEAYSDINTFAKDTTICADQDFTIESPISTLLNDFYGGNQKYLFQYSGNNGTTWSNISSLEVDNKYIINTKDYAEDKMLFRVVVATPDVLGTFLADPNLADFDDNCRNYSVTKPFTITRAGSLDMGDEYKTSACKGETVKLEGFANPELSSWKWTDKSGNDLTSFSSEVSDMNYSFQLMDETIVYFYGMTSDGCSGKRQYTISVNPTAEIKLALDTICGQTLLTTTVTPSNASISATLNGTPFALTAGETEFDETSKVGKLIATATATQYCESMPDSVSIIYKDIPSESFELIEPFCEYINGKITKSSEATTASTLPISENGYEVTWYLDVDAQTLAETDLQNVPGKTSQYTYYYTLTANGCTSKPEPYNFTIKPVASVTVDQTNVCDLTTLKASTTPVGATVTWNGVETGTSLSICEAEKKGIYSAVASIADYCESESFEIVADFYETPNALETSPVQYLKLEGKETNGIFETDRLEASVKESSKVASADIMWMGPFSKAIEPTDISSADKNPRNPEANISVTTDTVVYYYVYQKITFDSNTTCPSKLSLIEVSILGAPAPLPKDTVVCVNDSVDLLDLVKINPAEGKSASDYELLWNGSTNLPSVSTSQNGIQTFKVSQREKNTDNVSAPQTITIKVYGVSQPESENVMYCKNDHAVVLLAEQGAKSPDDCLDADGYKWITIKNGTNMESLSAPIPSTTQEGEQRYQVISTYNLNLSVEKYCYSEPKDISVNVYQTSAPSPQTIQYIKADALDGKTFPSINKARSPWIEEGGYDYYYSPIVKQSSTIPSSNYERNIPTPVFDVSSLGGGTQDLYCYVYRINKNNPIDCSSDTTLITIKITDALSPEVKDVYVCEGDEMPTLMAKVALLEGTGKTENDYDLWWYGDKEPVEGSSTPVNTTSSNTYSTGIISAIAENHKKTTYKYYVTQKDKMTGAESLPSVVNVYVLPKPEVIIKDVPAQCEGEILLDTCYSIQNISECGNDINPLYDNGNVSVVDESGSYGVTLSYLIDVSKEQFIVADNNECKSDLKPIKIKIDKLESIKIGDDHSVCPSGTLTLVSYVESSTHSASEMSYLWKDNKLSSNSNSTWEITYPDTYASEEEKLYTYSLTVTAGTCTKTSEPYEVKVGDGPVVGTMIVSEAENGWYPHEFRNDTIREFHSCGGAITLTIDYDKTEGEYSWYEDGTLFHEGNTINIEPTEVSSNKVYEVRYINKCETKADIIIKTNPLVGDIKGSDAICEGAQGKLDASSYGAITYEWTANGEVVGSSASLTVQPKETTIYNLEMTRENCKASDSYEMQVTTLPVITSIDSVGIRDREIVMEPGKGTGTFYYWVDVESSKATNNLVYNLTFAKHVVYVRDENGCETSMPFEVIAPPIVVPEFFTPNGDGINDTWVVETLREVYPESKVQIFDRYGKMMTEYNGGESDGWDGNYQGKAMPSTDYWYVIDIEEIDRQYTGHFTLIRQ